MSAQTRRRIAMPETPPPGPFRPGFWRSPLRGPQLTSLLGLVLLALVAIVATTGFLSHAAYMPDLPGNRLIAHALPLAFLAHPGSFHCRETPRQIQSRLEEL